MVLIGHTPTTNKLHAIKKLKKEKKRIRFAFLIDWEFHRKRSPDLLPIFYSSNEYNNLSQFLFRTLNVKSWVNVMLITCDFSQFGLHLVLSMYQLKEITFRGNWHYQIWQYNSTEDDLNVGPTFPNYIFVCNVTNHVANRTSGVYYQSVPSPWQQTYIICFANVH